MYFLLHHIPAKTLLVIPVSSVLKIIVDRSRALGQTSVPIQFHITKPGYRDYLIKNDAFRPDIPITLFSLDALWPCLQVVG